MISFHKLSRVPLNFESARGRHLLFIFGHLELPPSLRLLLT